MVEDADSVSAFSEFSIDDAGGDKAKPESDSKGGQEASMATEAPDSGSNTAPPAGAAPKKESSAPPAATESESSGERLQTSLDREPAIAPAAKKLALEKGVPIGQLKGTGPGGRITKSNV